MDCVMVGNIPLNGPENAIIRQQAYHKVYCWMVAQSVDY